MTGRRDRKRKRNARRRDRAQRTSRAGTPRVELVPMTRTLATGLGDPVVQTNSFPVGPVGRFARAVRRMDNYVAHGEFLEREVARAETPEQREAAQRALLLQIRKVERFAYVLAR